MIPSFAQILCRSSAWVKVHAAHTRIGLGSPDHDAKLNMKEEGRREGGGGWGEGDANWTCLLKNKRKTCEAARAVLRCQFL